MLAKLFFHNLSLRELLFSHLLHIMRYPSMEKRIRIADDSRSQRRSVQDALEVLETEAGFGIEDRAKFEIFGLRRREILPSGPTPPKDPRPIRSETRATLVASIARGRRWLDELTTDPIANVESIAKREGCSARKVNMTISLAFLAPDLVKAAIEGRLPRGMGVARLCDLPAEWSRQYQMLGLTSAEVR